MNQIRSLPIFYLDLYYMSIQALNLNIIICIVRFEPFKGKNCKLLEFKFFGMHFGKIILLKKSVGGKAVNGRTELRLRSFGDPAPHNYLLKFYTSIFQFTFKTPHFGQYTRCMRSKISHDKKLDKSSNKNNSSKLD